MNRQGDRVAVPAQQGPGEMGAILCLFVIQLRNRCPIGATLLGVLFRRLFLARLIRLHRAGKLAFSGSLAPLTDRRAFLRHIAPVHKTRWVAYAKAAPCRTGTVLAYLSL